MDIIDSNAETSSKSTYQQGSIFSKSFIDNLYYKYKYNFANYLIENKDSIKLLVNNSTMKKMDVADYFHNLDSSESLTPIPHMMKKKYKSEKEKKEFSKIERDAVCLRRIEYSYIYKQNLIIQKYNNNINNIILIQKIYRGFLFRQIMKEIKSIVIKIERFVNNIKKFCLLSIIKKLINKKNIIELKSIETIERDGLDFKNCFSDLMMDYFNDEKINQEKKNIHINTLSVFNINPTEKILKKNTTNKKQSIQISPIKQKLKKIKNLKKKQPKILEPYKNIINSIKKAPKRISINEDINNIKLNKSNIIPTYKNKKNDIEIKIKKNKGSSSVSPERKIKNRKRWSTGSFFPLKTNIIKEVDSTFEDNNNNSSYSSDIISDNQIKNNEFDSSKFESIDSNFEIKKENFPEHFNNNNIEFDPKIILLVLLLKKDIIYKIKSRVFILLKNISNLDTRDNNLDTIEDNFNDISRERFQNISLIFKRASSVIFKKLFKNK